MLRLFGSLSIFCNLDLMIREDKTFWVAITVKRWEIDMRILYILIGKLIWGVQWHYHIWPWVTLKAELGHMLLLNIMGNHYMGSSISKAFSRTVAELGHMLLLNTNSKSYMGSRVSRATCTLVAQASVVRPPVNSGFSATLHGSMPSFVKSCLSVISPDRFFFFFFQNF